MEGRARAKFWWGGYAGTFAVAGLATAFCLALDRFGFEASDLVMVYLGGVAIVAARWGPGEAIAASVASVAAFDFLFVEPRGTLAVAHAHAIVTFSIMLGVALLVSSLSQRLRRSLEETRRSERLTETLYRLGGRLAASSDPDDLCMAAARELRDVAACDVAIFLSGPPVRLAVRSQSGFASESSEEAVAAWVAESGAPAGLRADALPGVRGLYLPIRGSRVVGVLALLPEAGAEPIEGELRTLIEAVANALGVALERADLAGATQQARVDAAAERLRNALLSSISHDLRSPLTAIAGAAGALRERRGDAPELAETVYAQSCRLNLQVTKLLDMTRLRDGDVRLRLEWNSCEELVGAALEAAGDLLAGRETTVALPDELPLVQVDALLIEKVLLNLVENAAAHTPAGSPIELRARALSEFVVLDVADEGPGLRHGEASRIFERFSRGDRPGRPEGEGFGLGLAICRAIMDLHGGRIWAENRRDRPGAVFHVELKRRPPPAAPRE